MAVADEDCVRYCPTRQTWMASGGPILHGELSLQNLGLCSSSPEFAPTCEHSGVHQVPVNCKTFSGSSCKRKFWDEWDLETTMKMMKMAPGQDPG